eukprot:s2584_g1.t1
MLDSQLLDMVEESEQGAGTAAADMQSEPLAFRPSRSFALLLPNCVQVLRLTFKAPASTRAPATPGECCAYLAQLARSGEGSAPSKVWSWSLDDVGVPAFEEQRQHLAVASPHEPLPAVRMGRWLSGLPGAPSTSRASGLSRSSPLTAALGHSVRSLKQTFFSVWFASRTWQRSTF